MSDIIAINNPLQIMDDHISGLIIFESLDTGADFIKDNNAGSPPYAIAMKLEKKT